MTKMLVMEVYEVDADTPEKAVELVKGSTTRDSAVHASETLSGMFNPFHLAECQNKFGHIKAAEPVVAVEPVAADESLGDPEE